MPILVFAIIDFIIPFFERALDAVSLFTTEREKAVALSLKDIGGQRYLQGHKKHTLIKYVTLSLPSNHPSDETVTLFAEIRNSIARHRNGYIDCLPDDSKSLFYRLNREKYRVKKRCNGSARCTNHYNTRFGS